MSVSICPAIAAVHSRCCFRFLVFYLHCVSNKTFRLWLAITMVAVWFLLSFWLMTHTPLS